MQDHRFFECLMVICLIIFRVIWICTFVCDSRVVAVASMRITCSLCGHLDSSLVCFYSPIMFLDMLTFNVSLHYKTRLCQDDALILCITFQPRSPSESPKPLFTTPTAPCDCVQRATQPS